MRFRIHPEANDEEDKGADFYGERSFNLGLDFLAAVRAAYAGIREHPDRHPQAEDAPLNRNVRYLYLGRFQFRIIYWLRSADEIVILAIANTSRKPGYWKRRLKTI